MKHKPERSGSRDPRLRADAAAARDDAPHRAVKHRISALIAIATLLAIGVYACAYGAPIPQEQERLVPPPVDVVLVFCLAEAPEACQEVRPLLEAIPETACGFAAQVLGASWLADHPKWMLPGWRCEEYRPKEKAL